ncbi:MAG: head fiber protein [Comamonas sp.]|uniref:head fiber protein n=1 Tax=Comamonas sp. TaxID=34028 RepID=UPI002FC5D9E1
MGYATKNYTKPGGDETVIGGKLSFGAAAQVDNLPAATTSMVGGVKMAAAQADSLATDVAGILADFNALLAKLRAAGMLAAK